MPATLMQNIMEKHNLPQNDAILLSRSQLLEESDQALFKAIFIYKQNAEIVSKLTGLKGHWIRRRARHLAGVVTSKVFVDAMRAMPHMTPADAELARLHYCQGLTVAQIARRLDLTRYQIRRRLDRVRGLIATISQTSHVSIQDARGQGHGVLKLHPKGVFQCQSL
jgi:hypothetical protein